MYKGCIYLDLVKVLLNLEFTKLHLDRRLEMCFLREGGRNDGERERERKRFHPLINNILPHFIFVGHCR